MNICLVAHEYPPGVTSGSGKYAENLVKSLGKKGHKFTIITLGIMGGKEYEKEGNIEIYRLNVLHSKLLDKIMPNILDTRLLFSLKLRKFFRNFDLSNYEVLHIIDAVDSYFLDVVKKKLPVLISVNDYYAFQSSLNIFKFPYFSSDIILRYPFYNLLKFFNTKFLRKADRIITNSECTTKVINKVCKIPLSKIRTIHRGIDISSFSVRPSKTKYKNHNVLFIGKNMERKGAEYLIKAAPLILEKFPDSSFTIIGKGSFLYKAKLKYLIRKFKIKDRVKLMSFVNPAEIKSYYAKANVFCILSLIEALGQVQLEAMAAKTPVVATNVGGIPETIKDGSGILVKPKDHKGVATAIIKIFSQPEKAKKMGEVGFKVVKEEFNSKDMAVKNLKVYYELNLQRGGCYGD